MGEYIPTKKNPPAADLYERHGFVESKTSEDDVTTWTINLKEQTIDVPEWIELQEE